jgi:purine-binding chemotaxis protein CheW
MADKPNPIDWSQVWRDLNWDDAEQQAEIARQRLRWRAQQYAAPKKAEDLAEGYPTLVFRLDDEQYGLDVLRVHGVRTIGQITRVPGIPSFYRGVVNVRGQIVTALDLRPFFDSSTPPGDVPSEMVIVATGGLEIGLLAHDIEGVQPINMAAITPQESMQYALGITSDHITVLDLERLFADDRLIVGGTDNYVVDV